MKKNLSIVLCFMLIITACRLGRLSITAGSKDGVYTYTVSNGEAEITDVATSISGDVEMPSVLGNYPVTGIGASAFYKCKSLTGIAIPDGVKYIGDSAFKECDSLTGITIPNSITDIGTYAFYKCKSLTDITIPDGVTIICNYTFYNCSSLERITLPDDVTSIGNCAFDGCSRLTNMAIPNGVTSIGDFAFCGCSSLTTIAIPDGVTSINRAICENCTSLASVTIPKDVTKIYDYSFKNCTSLTSVTLPKGVDYINYQAFYGCTSLTSVVILSKSFSIENHAFGNCSALEDVYYYGTEEEWLAIQFGIGNDFLTDATVHYNYYGDVILIEVTSLPEKPNYVQGREALDLTGGELTVTYADGTASVLELTNEDITVTGFDNSVLGKQSLTVLYGGHTTELEVEIIAREVSFIAVSPYPEQRELVQGRALSVKGARLNVGYNDSTYVTVDLTEDMLSGYDTDKLGIQIVKVSLFGKESEFSVTVFKNGDLDGDGIIAATDMALLKADLLKSANSGNRYDINSDGNTDLLDLVRIKKLSAGACIDNE